MPDLKKKLKKNEIFPLRVNLKGRDLTHFISAREKIAEKEQVDVEDIQYSKVIKTVLKHYDKTASNDLIVVEPKIAWKLKRVLKSTRIQIKYPFSSLDEFFKYYAIQLLDEWEKNRKNLRDDLYDILSTLNPEYREIAMICSNLSSTNKEITISNIKSKLKKRSNVDKEIIISALNNLVADGYIEKMQFEGEFKYWVK